MFGNHDVRKLSLEDRLWCKIVVVENCWEWAGCVNKGGYGTMWDGLRREKAHRVSYRVFVGEIPAGLEIDHLCRNRRCVNPAHLEAVTPRENARRGNGAAGLNFRSVVCKRGHPRTEENTGVDRRGCRRCLICYRDAYKRHNDARVEYRKARYWAAKKENGR